MDLRACARTRSWAEAPTPEAVGQLIKKTTEDPDWFPGKIYGSLGGRPPLVSETNKSIMANSAMAMKERGIEPTCSSIIARCPNASINPIAGEPISKQVVHDILENRCYDIDPNMPWSHQKRLAKGAVLPQDIPKRLAFGHYMMSLRHTPYWYWRHAVWTDICNSVLPITPRKANAHTDYSDGGCAGDVDDDAGGDYECGRCGCHGAIATAARAISAAAAHERS